LYYKKANPEGVANITRNYNRDGSNKSIPTYKVTGMVLEKPKSEEEFYFSMYR